MSKEIESANNTNAPWYTYILLCADKTLYTGITTDLDRRVLEHNSNAGGAKYTRSRQPVALLFSENFENRSEASSREHEIKKMSRTEKLTLVASQSTKKSN